MTIKNEKLYIFRTYWYTGGFRIKMIIISHRGYWISKEDQNSMQAFIRSFKSGFGTETDIRDYKGDLVISHDIPDDKKSNLESFLQVYTQNNPSLILALNIKADGLQEKLKLLLNKYAVTNYFVFDMSVPEGIKYINQGFNAFTRQSEYEKIPSFYEQAKGIWIDCFIDDWLDNKTILEHLNANKKVCLVSPDLHKRNHVSFWKKICSPVLLNNSNLILCTDLPEKAKEFFYGKN